MRLETDRYGFRASVARAANDFGQHAGMRAVHTVKITHADEGWPKVSGNFVNLMEYLHPFFFASLAAFLSDLCGEKLFAYNISNLKLQFHPVVRELDVLR